MLRKALLIRRVEERLQTLFAQGRLFGTLHTCIGQEWTSVALANALDEGDSVFAAHRAHGAFLARGGDLVGFFSELMGKTTGVCGGLGGSQHLCAKGFYTNGVQGSMFPVSAGNAWSMKLKGRANIAVVMIGDGTLGQGVVYETMNIIAKWGIPLLVLLEDNGYAQSTPRTETLAGTAASRAAAFGIEYRRSDTWHWRKLVIDVQDTVQDVRNSGTPAFLEVRTYRLAPHSTGRDHRDPGEIARFRAKDPVSILLEEADDETTALLAEIDREIDEAVSKAEQAATPTVDAKAYCHVPAVLRDTKWSTLSFERERVSSILYGVFRNFLGKRADAVMIGEDIESPYGGAFNVTRDLSALFKDRVRNTPISEAAITGIGAGLALGGCAPIVEIMFGDFMTLTYDQLHNACKFRHMYNGQVTVPLVVRTPMGGKRGYGPTHSQSLEKFFMGIPDLTMVALNHRLSPSLIYERIFETAENPVLVIENKVLYTRFLRTEEIPGFAVSFSDESFPTTRISPVDATPDVTILCYGGMLEEAEEALGILFDEEEILCELICPALLCPLNVATVAASVRTTRRLVVVEEGSSICALGSEVLAQLAELSLPVERVRRLGFNSTIPCSGPLELDLLPNPGVIRDAVKEVCDV